MQVHSVARGQQLVEFRLAAAGCNPCHTLLAEREPLGEYDGVLALLRCTDDTRTMVAADGRG